MPLIQIRCNPNFIGADTIAALRENLPAAAAEVLSCKEGGTLAPKDIMLEFDGMNPLDTNNKDIHVRVWAHDYRSRRGRRLDVIRRTIAKEVLSYIPADASWYVWVLLAPTSYGSDTEG